MAKSRSIGSGFAEPSVLVSSTLPATQERAIEMVEFSQSISLHFSPAISLTRGPKKRATRAIVRNGSVNLASRRLNSLIVKILGTFVRFEDPFTRTRLIGFRSTGVNSQRIAQLKSKCIISLMWPLLFPASFKSLTQSSTGSGFTWAIGTSRHRGLIWVLIQLTYRERVTWRSGSASRTYRSMTAPNEVWSAG